VANAGLLDQVAALQWTQKYISYLGGDPDSITAMGESAGGSSIMHHITANGGTTTPIFNRAILQSPAFQPQYSLHRLPDVRYNDDQLNSQYESFASSAGCPLPSLSCLRALPSEDLEAANLAETLKAAYGHFQYGPAVDGVYVQDLPGRELLNGDFANGVELMIGHNRCVINLFNTHNQR